MPHLEFVPQGIRVDVDPGTKVLAAACRAKVAIRFGCGAGRCGLCAVQVEGAENLAPWRDSERQLLTRLGLPTDGTVRLACQTYIERGAVSVNLDFQKTYDPSDIQPEG